jgi:ABC-type lipopolysaccharide export system ATPase subunit
LEAGRLTIAGEAKDLLKDERVKQAYLGWSINCVQSLTLINF